VTGVREERKLKLKFVVMKRTGLRTGRDQSQTLAPDSAFAADRRIDRAQAPDVEMPVQVRPAQLDARWSKGRTRRHHD
jgi:hypothetical protein